MRSNEHNPGDLTLDGALFATPTNLASYYVSVERLAMFLAPSFAYLAIVIGYSIGSA